MSTPQALVVGGGPAGLMAAEELSRAGCRVTIAEAKPSLARKFLMAGKSGLNLTKDEPVETLLRAYGDAADWLEPMIRAFDAQALQDWARILGQELFTGSSGRVFPKAMKASPLLRAWLRRLVEMGADWRTGWRWQGLDGDGNVFDTPEGRQCVNTDVTVLALGGASWARLGSDGAWARLLSERGIALAPFAPSNAAIAVDWTDHMRQHFGSAIKSVRWTAGETSSRGEAIISGRGLEGGGIYGLTPALREGAQLVVDLVPDIGAADLAARFSRKRRKTSLSNWLRTSLRLPPEKIALFFEMARGKSQDPVSMLKALPVHHAGLQPLDEAISTTGGIRREAVDDGLMLRNLPGVFCAGEMLNWEAPTGGYLLTGCLATGRWAGRAAGAYASRSAEVGTEPDTS